MIQYNETKKFDVLLAFGSNLGAKEETIRNAWDALSQVPKITTQQLSPLYETEPVGGPAGQPNYINAAGTICTELPPLMLLHLLQKIEADFGRVRKEHWGARTLDIDILLYGDEKVRLPELKIPHPEMLNRQFVLIPACDVAAEWIHPLTHLPLHISRIKAARQSDGI